MSIASIQELLETGTTYNIISLIEARDVNEFAVQTYSQSLYSQPVTIIRLLSMCMYYIFGVFVPPGQLPA